jgi:poly(A) polymerase
VDCLRTHGYKAYLVGGCVRDLLLGIEPKDYDVATDARPEDVLALYPDADRVGAHFGVVLVHSGRAQVEVATFRSEGGYADGRRPDVVQFEKEPQQDALRRDFTINAMMLDPATDTVLDFAGGRQDLERKLVRAIGAPETRFREDYLRMLRAVRFAARFGFAIEENTLAAVRRSHQLAGSVAAERTRDELNRILTEGAARYGFELLEQSGLLQTLLPEIAAMRGVEQPPEYHPEGDVWTHTLLMLDHLPLNPPLTLAWGVLLHDVGKPGTFRVGADRIRFDGHVELGVELSRKICHRLRFSNDDTEQIVALLANHMRFGDATKMRDSTLKRFLRLPKFNEHLELHRIDCLSSHGMLSNYRYVKKRRDEFGEEQITPRRLLSGSDLIEAGYSPGPRFGPVLRAVEDAQLDGTVQTKEEALWLARTLLSEPASE